MPLSSERATEIADRIGNARVLILGDIMLDEYMFGTVDRISPEAPVPVVEISSEKMLVGGAANVAANIRALGDEPLLLGTVGRDQWAVKLGQLLSEKGISGEFLVPDPERQTTVKTRIIAHSQQVVRADREDRHELSARIEREILSNFNAVVDSIDAVIISDYGKGVICKNVLDVVINECLSRDLFLAVDPKETHFWSYRQVSVITPNHHEAGFAFGKRIITEADLLEVGAGLLEKLEAKSILITRGPQGMSLFRNDFPPTHIPTFARQVYDVTGAGDTVIASFVSAVCAGADLAEAAVVANAGAGVIVGEVGTATVTARKLREDLERNIRNGNLASTTTVRGRST